MRLSMLKINQRRLPLMSTVPAKASGVMLVQGGDFGGWTFYMKDGTPAYTYNWLGLEQFDVVAKQKVPAGHTR